MIQFRTSSKAKGLHGHGAPMARAALVLMAASTLLAGCNTVSGVGKDVRSAGDAVSDAAEGAK